MKNKITVYNANLNQNDPKIDETPNGKLAASFRIAENIKMGEKEYTNWYSVEAYDNRARKVRDNIQAKDHVEVTGTLINKQDEKGNTYPTILLDDRKKPLYFNKDTENNDEDGVVVDDD